MFTIPIRKTGESVDVDFDSLPANSVAYVIRYGLTQLVNDAHAPVVKKSFDPANWNGQSFDDAVMTRVNDRLDALRDGEIPGERTPSDPRKAESKRRAAALTAYTSDEFDAVLAMFEANRKAAE